MSRPKNIKPEAIGLFNEFGKYRVSTNDAIVYALGIGFNMGRTFVI